MSGVARKTYNAVLAKIFQSYSQQTVAVSYPTKISFRPRQSKSTISPSTAQSSSITGLRFCLHMVIFAAPGVILSKKLCDGEHLEDIVDNARGIAQNAHESLSALASKPA